MSSKPTLTMVAETSEPKFDLKAIGAKKLSEDHKAFDAFFAEVVKRGSRSLTYTPGNLTERKRLAVGVTHAAKRAGVTVDGTREGKARVAYVEATRGTLTFGIVPKA